MQISQFGILRGSIWLLVNSVVLDYLRGAFSRKVRSTSGGSSTQNVERMITIERKGILGTEPVAVYVDDGEYGIVHHSETKAFPIFSGMHRLQIHAASYAVDKGGLTVGQGNKNSYSGDVIYIKENDGDKTFIVTLNMFGKISIETR